MAFGKPKRRVADEDQRILPLINVVFLLLIFFMIAGQLSKTEALKIDPPVSDSGQKTSDTPLQIVVGADGRIVVAGTDVALGDLRDHLQSLREDLASPVSVKADASVDAVTVIWILDLLKASGATKVNLMTTRRTAP